MTGGAGAAPDGGAWSGQAGDGAIPALIWVDRAPYAWNETIAALLRMPQIGTVHVGVHPLAERAQIRLTDPRVVLHDATQVADLAATLIGQGEGMLLTVSWPSRPPASALAVAVERMADDPRIATVSFLSNSGGALSFPHRNTNSPGGVTGHDENTLTQLLRARGPDAGDAALVPIQVAEGAMVLLNSDVVALCGGLDDLGTNNLAMAVSEFSLRAARRGFASVADLSTFVTVPWDGVGPYVSLLQNPEARHALHQRYGFFPANHDLDRSRADSVLGQALDVARARATGLRVLIDGSALGPQEMGTQHLVLKLSLGLADRDDVQVVHVGVPDPKALPPYAEALARHRKVRLVTAGALDFPDAEMVDVLHRPYQPSQPIPWARWRQIAKRTVITVQDVIAYRNGAYFRDFGEWQSYRDNFVRQISRVDGVLSISHDVAAMIRQERLPVEADRVFVVENGANARGSDQPMRVPDAFLARGWAGSPFLFVLGATYAHKNRDLAIRVWAELRRNGYPHKLVLAGANVPNGSSRVEESLLADPALDPHLLVLPDIAEQDRNWLLGNTDLALYLTSAEGFGLIPYEAAQFGVPCLSVSFGPLRELIDDAALPRRFGLAELVARARTLLDDGAQARASVAAILRNSQRLSWSETARKSVDAYLAILDQPMRGGSL